VRAIHQGAPYFIGAPEGNAPGDISVYDVTAKVPGVFVEADVLEFEAANGQLQVTERYFVHNPANRRPRNGANNRSRSCCRKMAVEECGAQRPGGLPTSINLDADGPKGHYAFNFPIQPDDGDKSTLFEISYHVPYSGGTFTFKPQVLLPTQSIGVLLPKSMTFSSKTGLAFKSVPQDPTIQTFVPRTQFPARKSNLPFRARDRFPAKSRARKVASNRKQALLARGPVAAWAPPSPRLTVDEVQVVHRDAGDSPDGSRGGFSAAQAGLGDGLRGRNGPALRAVANGQERGPAECAQG